MTTPFEPKTNPKQIAFLLLNDRIEVLYGGAAGGGKLCHLECPIPTPRGFVRLANIHPGDFVFGRDGLPHLVEAESEVQIVGGWQFTFDDGSTVVTNDEHKWLTYDARELEALTRRTHEFRARRRATRPSRAVENPKHGKLQQATVLVRNKVNNPSKRLPPPTGTVRTTVEIVATLKTRGGTRANHAIPTTKPLQIPHRDLPIDPYLLGCWLGDGSRGSGQITSMDQEIHDAFASQYTAGSTQTREGTKAFQTTYLRLITDLKSIGVGNDKHIPHDYLWASIPQRLALLQGLMDTDGNVAGSSVEFSSTNQNLTEGVAHLLRSLGMKATVREFRTKLYGKDCGPGWRIKVAANQLVFRLPRKALAQSISTRRITQYRYIISATRVHALPMKCIRVSSPDHLYLASENLIPTHNSEALLQSASQYLDVPSYSALLLRKTFRDLSLPGALMDRSHQWWGSTDASWDGNNHIWRFPTGASVQFGYLANINDHLNYQSSAFQYIGIDEVTQFPESQYTYMFSRLRRLEGMPVPIRFRGATNPGGPGHEWVRERFNLPDGPTHPRRGFVAATLDDNPYLDQAEYERSFDELSTLTKAQLRYGDWSALLTGGKFDPTKIRFTKLTDLEPSMFEVVVRFWDLAATAVNEANSDPDWTVGLKLGKTRFGKDDFHSPDWYILDVARTRANPRGVEEFVRSTAFRDGRSIPQWFEQERGGAGKLLIQSYAMNLLPDFTVRSLYVTGDKETRASIAAARLNEGRVYCVENDWNRAFSDELTLFPEGTHDDQVDAFSGAMIAAERDQAMMSNLSRVREY